MTQEPEDQSRLDRIQAEIEAERQLNRERFQQSQERLDRIERQLEAQLQVNADIRTKQELQSQDITNLVTASENLLGAVQTMVDEFRQHRSDGHGA